MKLVTVLGSPRSTGNSATVARRITQASARLGAEVHTFELNRLNYRGCQGCYACKRDFDQCIVKDDLAAVLAAVADADAVVLASPVYYGDVSAQLKGFIDRTFSYLKPDYQTNPQPSRLTPKKLAMVLTQGHPDESLFADIYPRYEMFLKWMGFAETHLIRACGIGPARSDRVPEEVLRQAEALAADLLA